jgi:hypothetical protein
MSFAGVAGVVAGVVAALAAEHFICFSSLKKSMSHADSYSYSYSDDAYVFCVVDINEELL